MLKFMRKVRIVPLVIFASVLMLTFKVNDILNGIGPSLDTFFVSEVKAQGDTAPNQLLDLKNKNNDGAKSSKKKDNVSNPEDDPTLFSENEIKILQQLAKRREIIEARLEELNVREGLLGAAEKRIDKKIQEMKNLELAIKKLIKTHDDQEDLKIQSLVKIYENMKPKDAARIFGELDINTLLKVAERMKERKLAPIMAKMNPERAKEMTVALTKLRNLPMPGT